MEERDNHRCSDCGESLAQLDGEWYCPECDDGPGQEFTLDGSGDEEEFVL